MRHVDTIKEISLYSLKLTYFLKLVKEMILKQIDISLVAFSAA